MDHILSKDLHCAIICGRTNCGKTKFMLDILEKHYINHSDYIILFCPTLSKNKTYLSRRFIVEDKDIIKVNPTGFFNESLQLYYEKFKDSNDNILFIIDDCSGDNEIRRKGDILAYLGFSGRHSGISIWILTQKYNSVLKDFREQTDWTALSFSKDEDCFKMCIRENNVIHGKLEREKIERTLEENKYSKLVLKTNQPCRYKVWY